MMEAVLSYELLDNTMQTWLSFVVVTSAALAVAYLFKRLAAADPPDTSKRLPPGPVVYKTTLLTERIQ